MANRESGNVDRREIQWSYREIMETGSEELKAIIALITGGFTPGIPTKEDEENESN